MEDVKENVSLHIVMFPWLAFGHMMPYLELSNSLAERGNKISFISTPGNIKRLPKVSPNVSHLLTFIELPLPQLLPYEANATSDVPIENHPYLKKAFDGLESPLLHFLETSQPDWIIYDFVPHWLPPIAAKLGVPSVHFSIFNATFLSFLGPPSVYLGGEFEGALQNLEDFIVVPKWIPFDYNLAFKIYEILKMNKSIGENVSGVTDGFRCASAISGCDIVAIRTCTEMESESLSLLQNEIYRKPVIPIGLLPPRVLPEEDDKWVQVKDWLDKKKTKTVVYVAFGSEVILSQEEVTELALGLELSELPFYWALKTPVGATEVELPPGFENRVNEQGIICKGWAPQLKILSHPSVGGFLTHSGWSSVIESLSFGCPLVLLPLINDQGIVARFLEWKKITFEIPRDESDGSFTRKSVAESLRKLVIDKDGEPYRKKVEDLKEVIGDTTRHDMYIDEFARCLKERKHNKPKI
nr:glycosyltransferase [Helleborus thibetanus]